MKTLDLNNYDVEEITTQEKTDTNGGWLLPSILFQVVMEIIDGTLVSDFEKGRQEAKNALGK